MGQSRPIIFSASMIRAILGEQKRQTRRVITRRNSLVDGGPAAKWCWDLLDFDTVWFDPGPSINGYPGPFLKVRCLDHTVRRVYPRVNAGDAFWVRETYRLGHGRPVYRADVPETDWASMGPWRPAIYLPRRLSRITLTVRRVWPERLQDIAGSATSVLREGRPQGLSGKKALAWFRGLWDGLNAGRGYGWDVNPLVWVYEFDFTGVAFW